MGRCNFQRPCSKLHFNIVIKDDRDRSVDQWNENTFAFQMGIPVIIRVNADGGVAQDRFGPGGGNRHPRIVGTLYPVSDVIELRLHLFVDHLLVGNGRKRSGVPVYHSGSAIDQSLVVQIDEYIDHRCVPGFIHGKTGPIPVARGTQLFQLFQDDPSMFLFPRPGMF